MRRGWTVKARKGSSHLQLIHPTKGEFTWAFHESEEMGPKMPARIAKHTGLKPEDL
ncbi:MAG TPA: type II toxin-antitoxin system HicA family toxin [Terriglobia bacterium]|nr:type II toxin-antitoxin system HicA family toxin [Terriglobia bacterium]